MESESDSGGWSDEGDTLEAPKYLGVYIVTQDFIPSTNDVLTLELDNLVYVFEKSTETEGYWLGETKGITGLFPSSHVKLWKE